MKKTALVLGGGGSRGGYEIGVWKALHQLKIKVNMVMGTSVGAINGAMIAQGNLKLSEQLWQQLETEMIFDIGDDKDGEGAPEGAVPAAAPAGQEDQTAADHIHLNLNAFHESLKKKLSEMDIGGMPAEEALAYAKEIVTEGGAGNSGLKGLLNNYIDEKKVRRSRTLYGLVTTEFPSMEGHFLYLDDIPKGKLIDYILASASCFPAVQKCTIDGKSFIDGGYRDNMPVEMAMEKGADRIIAVDLQAAGFVRKDTVQKARESTEFHLIKSPLNLGNFLIFDKANTSRIMQLGYLDTMKEFGEYDGEKYTFKKGVFDHHLLPGADHAAYCLGLDPLHVYDESTLLEECAQRLEELKIQTSGVSAKHLMAQIAENLTDELRAQFLILIAKSLQEDQEKSLFLQPKVFKVLEGEIQAANFLIKKALL